VKVDQIPAVAGEKHQSTKRSTIKVGTRSSKLARLQTDIVIEQLRAHHPDRNFEIHMVTTGGDKNRSVPIAELGSQGVFVKELEDALLTHDVDIVVHSLKDLPSEMAKGLVLASVLTREDARDVLVSRGNLKFEDLPAGSRIATSSRRRAAQLRSWRQDLIFTDIRGNIPTRIQKHDDGKCDAIVLAAAGLIRLELTDRIAQYFDFERCVPAAGQGALAVECRAVDEPLRDLLANIDDSTVRAEIEAERALLSSLGGGCSVPIGAFAKAEGEQLVLIASVSSLDGKDTVRMEMTGPIHDPERLGKCLAQDLLKNGAETILYALRASSPNAISPP
jgi:hydroxymethylbilane synthase